MTNSAIPPLASISSSLDRTDTETPLAVLLALLFEPSPILYSELVPKFSESLRSSAFPATYEHLVDLAIQLIQAWNEDLQAQFIAGHPRIGEVSGLSKLSAAEQAAKATSPAVLARLAHLNACYEHVYPGLRYITFVNGRSRAEVMEEMEDVLRLDHSLEPDAPSISSLQVVKFGGDAWVGELRRAVVDVGKIAKARVQVMGHA